MIFTVAKKCGLEMTETRFWKENIFAPGGLTEETGSAYMFIQHRGFCMQPSSPSLVLYFTNEGHTFSYKDINEVEKMFRLMVLMF
jgi:hypothetical protein